MANVAQQAKRFDDMFNFLKQLMKVKGGEFTLEERNLLTEGFKNLIDKKLSVFCRIRGYGNTPKYKKFIEDISSYKMKI